MPRPQALCAVGVTQEGLGDQEDQERVSEDLPDTDRANSRAMIDTSSAAENIVPLPAGGAWDTVSVRIPPPRPRIVAGSYWGRSVSLRKYEAFKRPLLELGFDIYQAEPADSVVLARLPMFIRLPEGGDKLSPNSRLATMLYMLGQVRGDKIRAQNLEVLQFKLWRVEVADTQQDHSGKLKNTEIEPYSVVRRVVARG
jgi:hypothetical protein